MSLFPMFLKLQGRTVVVVGAGAVAEGKIPGLLAAQALVRVIAPEATPQIARWASEGKVELLPRKFLPGDLRNASLVIAATSAPGVNHSVFKEAEAHGIFCNAVDDIENCHFYYGAVVQRGNLQLAISTNGKSPALAQRIRKELEESYSEDYAAWLEKLGNTRDVLRRSGGPSGYPDAGRDPFLSDPARTERTERVKAILHRLASKETFDRAHRQAATVAQGGALRPLRDPSPIPSPVPSHDAIPKTPGKVFLVGAGPGDPDLLTQKAARLLQTARVVLHDSLVSREVLDQISPAAEIIDVGKRAGQKLLTQEEINSLLVFYARNHQTVVRLKGGDPGIFGRVGEEIDALRRANVPFEIVPGITAATAAAAAAGISLTDRRVASQVLLTTFSRGVEGSQMDWGCVTSTTTLVLYMPGPEYAEVSARLRDGGLPADLPCAVVSAASSARQMVRRSTISRLATEEKLPAPALLIVGRVASQHLQEISERAFTVLDEVIPVSSATRLI
jgi:uroporphyrin-III C-methyltransferase / precorrin-2 dehydrogenase / sirohydrochlorin ferrochelatase